MNCKLYEQCEFKDVVGNTCHNEGEAMGYCGLRVGRGSVGGSVVDVSHLDDETRRELADVSHRQTAAQFSLVSCCL